MKGRRVRFACLVLAAALGGCGWIRVPAQPGPAAPPETAGGAAPVATSVPWPPGGTVVVQRGDTLYGIARRYGVPVRGLIRLNDLQPPYLLNTGDVIRLPPAAAVHTVAAGETLYGISRRYGVDMARLVRDNGLDPPEPIVPGQKLIIPEPTATAAVAAPASASAPPKPAMTVETETLPPLPPAKSSEPEAPQTPSSGSPAAPVPPERSVAAVPPQKAAPRRSGRFQMPVEGKILSGYGAKSGGLHNDGINIAAPRGTPVVAAEDGTVAYAGNELPGFGNLVLIRHSDGWITAYGHNDEILVKKGQTVKRGQPIARVGSSGNVDQPQVHFEIRRGSRAVDPLPYLGEAAAPPRSASAG